VIVLLVEFSTDRMIEWKIDLRAARGWNG